MTNAEVLKRAISIAVENGWKDEEGLSFITIEGSVFMNKSYTPPNILFDVKEILFDHSFAKAFWGEEPYYISESVYQHEFHKNGKPKEMGITAGPFWQYHLQQMVLEENPIDYLRKFVEVSK